MTFARGLLRLATSTARPRIVPSSATTTRSRTLIIWTRQQMGCKRKNTYDWTACSSQSFFSSSGDDNNQNGYDKNKEDPHALFREQMEQMAQERENTYGFTEEEHTAWGNAASGNDQLPPDLMHSVEEARAEQHQEQAESAETEEQEVFPPSSNVEDHNSNSNLEQVSSAAATTNTPSQSIEYQPSHGLTHLSEDGSSVNMVDVGNKASTQRIAIAQTKVILPPEVVEAFQFHQGQKQQGKKDELIGPKGPIFATAKIAGIMAAK